jgi:hypothetical protein
MVTEADLLEDGPAPPPFSARRNPEGDRLYPIDGSEGFRGRTPRIFRKTTPAPGNEWLKIVDGSVVLSSSSISGRIIPPCPNLTTARGRYHSDFLFFFRLLNNDA